MGGFAPPDTGGERAALPRLMQHALDLSGRDEPRVCFLNTAAGDEPGTFTWMYSALLAAGARPSHLQLFPMPNVAERRSCCWPRT